LGVYNTDIPPVATALDTTALCAAHWIDWHARPHNDGRVCRGGHGNDGRTLCRPNACMCAAFEQKLRRSSFRSTRKLQWQTIHYWKF